MLCAQQVIPVTPCVVGNPQTGWQTGWCLPVVASAAPVAPAPTPAPVPTAKPAPRPRTVRPAPKLAHHAPTPPPPAPATAPPIASAVPMAVLPQIASSAIVTPATWQALTDRLVAVEGRVNAVTSRVNELGDRVVVAEKNGVEALATAQRAEVEGQTLRQILAARGSRAVRRALRPPAKENEN